MEDNKVRGVLIYMYTKKSATIKKHYMDQLVSQIKRNKMTINGDNSDYIVLHKDEVELNEVRNVGGLQINQVRYLTYEEFNDNLEITNNDEDSKLVGRMPFNTYKTAINEDSLTYYIQYSNLFTPMFKRQVTELVGVEYTTKIEGQLNEVIKGTIVTDFDRSRLEDITFTLGDGTRLPYLEQRARRIYENFTRPLSREWLEALSYWVTTVDKTEPKLLGILTQGESIRQYRGEED